MESENHNKQVTVPVYVLLPMCTETKSDVFLNILRNVVGHSKIVENLLDYALQAGMTAETFTIDTEDVMVHWNELNTKSKEIRQSKMLGYWAIENFPSLGKKLHGEPWLAPQRKCVQVVDGNRSLKPDEVDDLIFQKMKKSKTTWRQMS